MSTRTDPLEIDNPALGVGILHQDTETLGREDKVLVVPDDNLDSLGLRSRLDDLDGLRMALLRDEE